MANVNIEVQARTDQALRNLNNLTKGAGGMMAAFKDDAAGALGVFGVSLTAVNQPLTLVADTLKQSITAAANWGDEMGDLAALTGQTVEETSEMAATFELVGIKGGTLNKVLKSLADDGINLNMRSLKELSAQYQKLKDPVEKNRFLFEHFGKSAADMAEIMGRSTEELDRLTLAAKNSGKVIGGEAADAAEEFNVSLAILQQKAEGAQIALGNALIPTLNDAFTGFDNLVKVGGAAAIAFGQLTGAISDEEAAARAAALAAGDLGAGILSTKDYAVDLRDETIRLSTYTAALAEEGNGAQMAIDAWTASMQDAYPAASDLSSAIDHTSVMAAGLSLGMGELTTQVLYNKAAAGLDSLAALELARSMGLIDEEAYAAGTAVEELRQKYDTNKDGAISAAEGASQFAREAANLARELNLIPTNVSTTISVTKIGDENFGGWTAPAGAAKSSGGADTQINGMRAMGGPVSAGGAYIVGEQGPELFVPRQSGTVVANGGGQDEALRAALLSLPASIARAVRDGMQMAAA